MLCGHISYPNACQSFSKHESPPYPVLKSTSVLLCSGLLWRSCREPLILLLQQLLNQISFQSLNYCTLVLFEKARSQHPLGSQYLSPSLSLSHACMHMGMHTLLNCYAQMMEASSHTTSSAKPRKPKESCLYLCVLPLYLGFRMDQWAWIPAREVGPALCWACLSFEFFFAVPSARDSHI